MRIVGIYRDQDLIFSTGEVNPLMYNIIRGFSDIGRRLYGERLISIRIYPYTIGIAECSKNAFAFTIEDSAKCARDLLDRACEAYGEYETSDNSDVFLRIDPKP